MPTTTIGEEFECDNCGAMWATVESAESCCRYQCLECGTRHGDASAARDCCRCECDECGWRYETEGEADACCGGYRRIPQAEAEQFLGEYDFLLDGDRPPRLTSIEQELSWGSGNVLSVLKALDFIDQRRLDSYNTELDSHQSMVVKSDGSLGAGGCEIVYGRWNLYRHVEASKLGRRLSVVRAMKAARQVRTGVDAGTHIHVSARAEDGSCVTPRTVSSLYGICVHIEDLLFRLASAGWPSHRSDEGNDDYASPLVKFTGEKSPNRVRLALQGNRYYAVNFERLFNGIGRCRCGACSMAAWNECTCSAFDNATIEWRVFNASTKPETLHAWAVTAHALTAKAITDDYSELRETPYRRVIRSSDLRKQIKFLLDSPMSGNERDLVVEALLRSPGVNASHING